MSELRTDLETRLDKYFGELEASQKELVELLDRQQICLVAPSAAEMLELNRQSLAVTERLERLLRRRTEIIEEARSRGYSTEDLRGLAEDLSGPQGAQTQAARRLSRSAEVIRRANQSQWVACQKAMLHYRQLVELIANGGKNPLLTGGGKLQPKGGVILDASV